MCATRRQRGKDACSFSKSVNAERAETAVWDAVSALLTDPKTLKSDCARGELAALASWRESLEAFEGDKELLLESYAARAPEALNSLGPEERRTVYSMLGLRVDALPDKSLRVQGALGEENLVWENDRTSIR